MSLLRLSTSVLCALLFVACDSSDPPVEMPADGAGAASGGAALVATTLAFDLVETLGDMETLVVESPAETIAANLHGTSVGLISTCGTVVRAGTTITVTIMAEGCVLPEPKDPKMPVTWDPPAGATAGTVTMFVTREGDELIVESTFAAVEIHGMTIDGSVTLRTTDGLSWALALDIDAATPEETHVTGNVTLALSLASRTFTGNVTSERAEVSTTAQLVSIVWNRADCYPSSGTLVFDDASSRSTVVTFDEATASSGVVTVEVASTAPPEGDAGAGVTATLPAYGECPAS